MWDEPMRPYYPQPYFAYSGEYGDWLMVISRARDRDDLAESNFEAAYKLLTEDRPDWNRDEPDVTIECASHWLVGWAETILVKPGSEAEAEAYKIRARLAGYPVLDDDDFCERETETILSSLEGAIDDHYRRHPYPYTHIPLNDLAHYLYREGEYEVDHCYPEFVVPYDMNGGTWMNQRDMDEVGTNRQMLARALRKWRREKAA